MGESGRKQTVEYAVRHPAGHVDDVETATRFGATDDPLLAMRLLDVAESDCLCSDGGTHSLVTRTVTVEVTPWVTA